MNKVEFVAPEFGSREEEFVELLTQHKHQLFNFIFCILHSLSDAEEVFQETSIALWENFDKFKPNSDFAAWASKVARYRISSFIRSKRRERRYFSERMIRQLAACPFDPNEVQDARLLALGECLKKLSSRDQLLISACYGSGNSIRDAAKCLHRSVQAVYTSLSRIRRALFECIERSLAREARL